MDNQPPPEPSRSALPSEVALVRDALTCNICKYFWQPPTRSGPFPGFNWQEDYPSAMRDFSGFPGDSIDWMEGVSMPAASQRPEIMDGCRKAPIMTVGHNPKLIASRADASGASAAYPQFLDEDGVPQFHRHAYFARYTSIYEVSFDLEFIRENLDQESVFRSERSGWLLSAERSLADDGSHDRLLTIKVLYDNDDHARSYSFRWGIDEHFAVLFDPLPTISPVDKPQFEAGEVIAGKLALNGGKNTRLRRGLSGYHERMIPILETLTYIAGTELRGSQLSIGEDVAQIDLIACASPGWGPKHGIDSDTAASIASNCIGHARGKAFWLRQLVMTQPAVLMIVSRESLELTLEFTGRYFPDEFRQQFLDAEGALREGVDEFDLLKACCENEWFFEIREQIGSGDERREYHLRSRLLILPNFSDPENFVPQVRFPVENSAGSTINEWKNFCRKYPYTGQLLESGRPLYPVMLPRVHEDPEGGTVNVWLMGEEDPVQTMINNDAWAELIDSPWYVDPTRQIARALLEELDGGRLSYDADSGHLTRAEGGCRFCDNAMWKFPEGCLYSKTEEEQQSPEFLEEVVKAVLWR